MKNYLEDIVGDESDEEINYQILLNDMQVTLISQLIGTRIPVEEIPWEI